MSATNRGSKRKTNDLYETPSYSIESLLNVLDLTKVRTFLEPCKASGNIYKKIDVPNKYWAELLEGKNYLTTMFKPNVDLIITNPPFSLAQEFISKSLQEGKSVWYLLRINYLESLERHLWWQGKEPTHLLTLSARPSFTGKGTDATGYAWFGWDYAGICKLKPGIHILPYLKY